MSPALAQGALPPAQSIADKFAKEADKADVQAQKKREAEAKRKADAEKKKREEARRKAEEREMLGQAHGEARNRRLEQDKARAETEAAEEKLIAEAVAAEAARRAAEQQKADDEQRIAEAKAAEERRVTEVLALQKAKEEADRRGAEEAKRIADLRIAEEARRAAEMAAAAAVEAKRQAELRALEERRVAETLAAARARETAEAERRVAAEAEARRIAVAKAAEDAAHAAQKAEEQRQQAMSAEREAETDRLAEKLREARAQRQAQEQMSAARPAEPSVASAPSQPSSDNGDRSSAWQSAPGHGFVSAQAPERVTVLMRLEPGNRGIRRTNKSADPLLCTGHGCYVSNGSASPAAFLSGRRALGFGRTFGGRAGACSNQLGCVFRDVDYTAIAGLVQPVDMRVVKHDRREPRALDGVSECVGTKTQLTCRRTIETGSYVLWIVPEALAETVGPAILEKALDDGLPRSEQAALVPTPFRH